MENLQESKNFEDRLRELETQVKKVNAKVQEEMGRTQIWKFLSFALMVITALLVMAPNIGNNNISAKDYADNIVFRDSAGKTRLILGLNHDGSPNLTMHDSKGNPRSRFCVLPDGPPSLSMYDSKGNLRSRLCVNPEGTENLIMCDSKGKIIWSAP